MTDSIALAREIRRTSLQMVARARASHIGGAFSMADALAVLYSGVLNVRPAEPDWSTRDRLILSKGHSCTSLYAALGLRGFFDREILSTYGQDGSPLMAHISHKVPGVEFSTGSLGHGLPFACGLALGAKRRNETWRTFVIVSDGELNEGSNWEAILFAPQHRLDNLTLIVDYNKIQSLGRVEDVLELEPIVAKFEAFRWNVRRVDGHDHEALASSLGGTPWAEGRPSCLIMDTVKGKGVKFMEDQLLWHYKSPSADELERALEELAAE